MTVFRARLSSQIPSKVFLLFLRCGLSNEKLISFPSMILIAAVTRLVVLLLLLLAAVKPVVPPNILWEVHWKCNAPKRLQPPPPLTNATNYRVRSAYDEILVVIQWLVESRSNVVMMTTMMKRTWCCVWFMLWDEWMNVVDVAFRILLLRWWC